MNNILKICFLIAISFMYSCETTPIEDYSNLSAISWHLSNTANNDSPIVVNKGTHLSMMDISQGCISHEWKVPENSGIYFLSGKMNSSNPSAEEYESMISNKISYINHESTIHLLFKKAGNFKVYLRNTFKHPVAYTYSEKNTNIIKTIYSKKEGDVYVFEMPFDIKVYDNIMVPKAKVYRDEEHTKIVDEEEITIEYGDKLYFVDESIDSPSNVEWSCGNNNIAIGNSVFFQFNTITKENSPLQILHTIEREANIDKYIPAAPKVSELIPLKINVIPSSAPINIGKVCQLDSRRISLSLANASFDKSTISLDDKNDFELTYTNNGAGINTPKSILITDVKIEENDPTTIILTTSEDMYNTDILKLKYIGDAGIGILYNSNKFSLDNVIVQTNVNDYIKLTDFEDGVVGNWKLMENTLSTLANVQPIIVDNPIQSDVNSSNKVLKVDATNVVGEPILMLDMPFTGYEGIYTLSFKFNTNTKNKGLNPCINNPTATKIDDAAWSGGITPQWVSLWGAVTNTWYNYDSNPKVKAVNTVQGLRFIIKFNGWRGILYFDDFYFGNKIERP